MIKRVRFLVATLLCMIACLFQGAFAQTFSLYGGAVEEALEHFRSEGFHMRGIISLSEAVFKTSDGKNIPYGDIKFEIAAAGKTSRTICFEVVSGRCDALPIEPDFLIPLMNWISNKGTSAFTLAQERSLTFLKSIDMQPVAQIQGGDGPTGRARSEYVAAPLNNPSLVKVFRDIDYKNTAGPDLKSEQAREIIKRFNEGTSDTGRLIDRTYTVNDYFSQFIVTVDQKSVSFSGVPTRLYWRLYEGHPPFVVSIAPLLTIAEIEAQNVPKPDFVRGILRSVQGAWDTHVVLCGNKGYAAKIRAVDHYLAFVQAGEPSSKADAIFKELEEQGFDDEPSKRDRDQLVERRKHCDKATLESVSKQLEEVKSSTPELQKLERMVADLPKGFEDLSEELTRRKEAEARWRRQQEVEIGTQKRVQQETLDFYYSVSILRGLRRNQPEVFAKLHSKLLN